MPPVTTRPILSTGSGHDAVHELGQLLAKAGCPNSVSRGENPHGVVDDTILTAAAAFRAAHDVPEETAIPGVPKAERDRWIGPELWKALAAWKPVKKPAPAKPAA